MRVSLVTETYPPEINGVARTLERLATGLGRRGHEVSVVRPRPAEPPRNGGVPQTIVGGAPLPGYGRLRFGWYCPRRLVELWDGECPDVVHVATEGPLGLAAVRAARRRGLPVVSSFHTNFDQYFRFYGFGALRRSARSYLRWFHNRTARTLVPTAAQRDALTAAGFARVGVLSRGVDADLFHPGRRDPELRAAWGANDESVVVLYVGRLAAEKNLALLERAAREVLGAVPGSRVVLVGDGPEQRRLRRRHADFHFCGERRGEDLAAHYASADLFLFPSLTETFGNVVTEAMASGLAVVSFGCAAAAELIDDGIDGALVSPGDDDAFARRALDLAVGAREGLRGMGERARRAAEGHSWDAVVGRWEAVLRDAASAGAAM
ncbi:MAG: glycosyltransferase family 1 protein [Thermoanaerobaculia bacterium]